VRGFDVRVACSGFGGSRLVTITVGTDYFADFAYPIKILVRVDPPDGFGLDQMVYLWRDGDYDTFDWPADFFFPRDPVPGIYRVTVEADNESTIGWKTIASGSFTIR
jgi:hypothetical protein